MIDEGVGQLLATLREEGLFEETLIVFSADHGEFGGQFRAFYKGLPYEASCHVPLIIRDPRASGGRRCELNTSNIDLFSTILTTAGVNPPDDIESRDLTNLVAGSESGWDNRTVWKKGNQSFLIRDRSKLIRGIVGGHVVYELYDLATDPLEERNLIDDADRGTTIDALRQELDAWHQEQHDKGRARIATS
jgi:arylsulfatase A-like enzyme